MTTPHFDYPFRFGPTHHAVVVEQDSIEEIESCVVAVLLTEEGQRIELPEFGVESELFGVQPLDTNGYLHAILDQEPRAAALVTSQPDPVDYLKALVEVDVNAANPPIGDS